MSIIKRILFDLKKNNNDTIYTSLLYNIFLKYLTNMNKMLNQYYKIKRYIKKQKSITESFVHQKAGNLGQSIHHYNWWPEDSHSKWLHDFIVSRGIMNRSSKTLALCSVFERRDVLYHVDTDYRIFFSGENLHNPRHAQYADYMLSGTKTFDLAIGFDNFDNEKYVRFPLWLTYIFPPNATEDDIRTMCAKLRYPRIDNKTKFASLIARYDWNGVRTEIYNKLVNIGQIDCPSALLHNDDSLVKLYADNKREYLRQYKYNICPENTNAYGYVTEKLFEAIYSGCIPIYWGSYNKPELDILNQEVILFWNKDGDNNELIENLHIMCSDNAKFLEFARQPRLLDIAEERILEYFTTLEGKLKYIVNAN